MKLAILLSGMLLLGPGRAAAQTDEPGAGTGKPPTSQATPAATSPRATAVREDENPPTAPAPALPSCARDLRTEQGLVVRSRFGCLLEPEYRSARRTRRTGILVAAIGGGVGLGLGALTAGLYGRCEADHRTDCGQLGIVTMISWIVVGASLGVGIPLGVVGQRRMTSFEQRHRIALPTLDLRIAAGYGQLRARWLF